MSNFLELDNLPGQIYFELNIRDQTKPTLVFLHDSLGCATLWRDFPKLLSDLTSCNYLIIDRLGYGKSDPDPYMNSRDQGYMERQAEILIDILVKLDIKSPILFGHSDGGSIALIAGGKSPDYIHGIITEGAHVFVEEETLSGIRSAVELYQSTDLRNKLEKYHGDKTDSLFKGWTETWLNSHYRDWNIEHFLKDITCPVLVFQGVHDEYGTLDQVEAIVNGVSGFSQSCALSNAAHSPHKEDRESTLNASARFIKQHCMN